MKSLITLATCVLLSNTISAEIITIDRMGQLEDTISPLKSSDWFLFDIDYTLTEPSHPALQMSVIKQNKQRFKEELAKFTDAQKQLIPVLMVTETPNQLTDPAIPSFLQKLRDRNIPILGFTAMDTSVIPQIGSVPIWRVKELQRHGISFHPNQPSPFPKEDIEFTEFLAFRGTFPLYQDGILYANVIPSKGAVLSAFLAKVTQKPTKIVFVDDTLENLQSVEAVLSKEGIPFLGIHYKVQVDEAKSSKVGDEEWRSVWDSIHKRASSIPPFEGILQTGNVAAIQWASESMPENSLIIFDVGNVLLANTDTVLGFKYRHWMKEWFDREAPEIDKNTWRALGAIVDREAKMNLVHPALPAIISHSKENATVIALSKFFCGPSGDSSFEEHRLAVLKNAGINFDEPFPNASGWNHKELQATYSKGLIQTEAPLKGPVLKAFLEQISWRPTAILFIDDRRDQCDSITATLKELGIPALCIQYTEAIDRIQPLDPAIADLQLRTLVNEKRWISDEVARALRTAKKAN